MTQENEILDTTIEMIGDAATPVGPETNVARDLGLDSLAIMNPRGS